VSDGGWEKYEVHVLEQLRQVNRNIGKLFSLLGNVREEVSALKARVALYGAIAGVVTSAVISIVMALLKG